MAAILTHRESECIEVRGAKLGIISGCAQWVCIQDPHRRPQEVMSQYLAICHTSVGRLSLSKSDPTFSVP